MTRWEAVIAHLNVPTVDGRLVQRLTWDTLPLPLLTPALSGELREARVIGTVDRFVFTRRQGQKGTTIEAFGSALDGTVEDGQAVAMQGFVDREMEESVENLLIIRKARLAAVVVGVDTPAWPDAILRIEGSD